METIDAGNYMSGLALVVASVGLFLNFWELRKNNVRNRAEFILEYFSQYLADTNSVELFYKIDYGKFKYNSKKFHNTVAERKLDKLLMYFDRISLLYELGIVKFKDLKIVEYEFKVIANNKDVQAYLAAIENPEIGVNPYRSLKRVSSLFV